MKLSSSRSLQSSDYQEYKSLLFSSSEGQGPSKLGKFLCCFLILTLLVNYEDVQKKGKVTYKKVRKTTVLCFKFQFVFQVTFLEQLFTVSLKVSMMKHFLHSYQRLT